VGSLRGLWGGLVCAIWRGGLVICVLSRCVVEVFSFLFIMTNDEMHDSSIRRLISFSGFDMRLGCYDVSSCIYLRFYLYCFFFLGGGGGVGALGEDGGSMGVLCVNIIPIYVLMIRLVGGCL
jgi:hypothetical protein